jgi:hypothetical protein
LLTYKVEPGDSIKLIFGGAPRDFYGQGLAEGGFNGGADGTVVGYYTTASSGATEIYVNGERALLEPGEPGNGIYTRSDAPGSVYRDDAYGLFKWNLYNELVNDVPYPPEFPEGPLTKDSYDAPVYTDGSAAFDGDGFAVMPGTAFSHSDPLNGKPGNTHSFTDAYGVTYTCHTGGGGAGYGGGTCGLVGVRWEQFYEARTPSLTAEDALANPSSAGYSPTFNTPCWPDHFGAARAGAGAWGRPYHDPDAFTTQFIHPGQFYNEGFRSARQHLLASIALVWRKTTPWSFDRYSFGRVFDEPADFVMPGRVF